MDINSLFQRPNALPSTPKVVQELISSFEDEKISVDDIARTLATDPVLSAKLLRLANSSYYQVSRSISNIQSAITMLGFVTVRTLVISSGLVNGFKSTPNFDLQKFWRYSLNTAVIAKWLAQQTDENADLAFTIGLTHAIGQLVIHAAIPEQAIELDKACSPFGTGRLELEQATFGYDHTDVGAELVSLWKFPDTFVDAIHGFPSPLELHPFNRIAAILHLSVWLARAHENQLPPEEICATYPVAIAIQLGLEPSQIPDTLPTLSELSSGLEELVS